MELQLTESSFLAAGIKVNRQDILEVLARPLAHISNNYLSNLVYELLENHVPPRFFMMPPSSTAKYHPKACNRPGGLVIHTLRNLEILKGIFSGNRVEHGAGGVFTQEDEELAFAATILHDITKGGKGWGKGSYLSYQRHPFTAGDLIYKVGYAALPTSPTEREKCSELLVRLVSLVVNHMGPFRPKDGPALPCKEFSALHHAVYWADLLSSKPNITLQADVLPCTWLVGLEDNGGAAVTPTTAGNNWQALKPKELSVVFLLDALPRLLPGAAAGFLSDVLGKLDKASITASCTDQELIALAPKGPKFSEKQRNWLQELSRKYL